MDVHLPPDRDYRLLGGLVTLSTEDPQDHNLFMEYLAANPDSPLQIDIPNRDWYRGKLTKLKKLKKLNEFSFLGHENAQIFTEWH